MPTWGEILGELRASEQKHPQTPAFDRIRREYIIKLYEHTQRNVILYASAWLQKGGMPGAGAVAISAEDIQGFMEAIYGLEGDKLDLILHSPGGSPETAEAIVSYLRSRFSDIRVIVPQFAMSAATMIACAADRIVLGKHSFLGPTDPQLLLSTKSGPRLVPAQAILDQFDRAQRDAGDPKKLSSWLPSLDQIGPDLLIQCESVLKLSQKLVRTWLGAYMFKDAKDQSAKAKSISEWLADHKHFGSHARPISREELEHHQLMVERLEDDQKLQDLVLSVFHSTTHTFVGTPATKIIENHKGRAFIKLLQLQKFG